MALIEIVDQNELKHIQSRIRNGCIEFNQLNVGSKAKAAAQLYTENRILKELVVAAVDTIERLSEEVELKGIKINTVF